MATRVVFAETRRCALTGEEFVPKVPWQKYAQPGARRAAHRATLTQLRRQLAEMAKRLQEADRDVDAVLGQKIKLAEQVRGLGAVPVA